MLTHYDECKCGMIDVKECGYHLWSRLQLMGFLYDEELSRLSETDWNKQRVMDDYALTRLNEYIENHHLLYSQQNSGFNPLAHFPAEAVSFMFQDPMFESFETNDGEYISVQIQEVEMAKLRSLLAVFHEKNLPPFFQIDTELAKSVLYESAERLMLLGYRSVQEAENLFLKRCLFLYAQRYCETLYADLKDDIEIESTSQPLDYSGDVPDFCFSGEFLNDAIDAGAGEQYFMSRLAKYGIFSVEQLAEITEDRYDVIVQSGGLPKLKRQLKDRVLEAMDRYGVCFAYDDTGLHEHEINFKRYKKLHPDDSILHLFYSSCPYEEFPVVLIKNGIYTIDDLLMFSADECRALPGMTERLFTAACFELSNAGFNFRNARKLNPKTLEKLFTDEHSIAPDDICTDDQSLLDVENESTQIENAFCPYCGASLIADVDADGYVCYPCNLVVGNGFHRKLSLYDGRIFEYRYIDRTVDVLDSPWYKKYHEEE